MARNRKQLLPFARLGYPGRSVFSDLVWKDIASSLSLSPREFQIVQAIFDDQVEFSIAAELGISSHTVHTYLERLYRKLGVSSRCQLILCFISEYFQLHHQSKSNSLDPVS